MPFFLNLLVRAVLVAVGLFLAAMLAMVFVLVFGFWLLRAAWARLTGRPMTPFSMRMGPRGAFDEMMRRAQQQASRTPRADSAGPLARGRLADVSDVEPK
jgi:hypothetical protein